MNLAKLVRAWELTKPVKSEATNRRLLVIVVGEMLLSLRSGPPLSLPVLRSSSNLTSPVRVDEAKGAQEKSAADWLLGGWGGWGGEGGLGGGLPGRHVVVPR